MSTLDYYNNNAKIYFDETINADMSIQYNLFLKYLAKKGKILDFGCGSGRDSKYFKDLGYDVTAIDGSKELCKLAKEYTLLDVKCKKFNELNEIDIYDGIWACASLLHVPKNELKDILIKMRNALKNDGIIYISMKDGNNEEIDNKQRYYNYLTKENMLLLINDINLKLLDYISTKSVSNPNESRCWSSYILKK